MNAGRSVSEGYQVAKLNRDGVVEHAVYERWFGKDIVYMLTVIEGLVMFGGGRTDCVTCGSKGSGFISPCTVGGLPDV